MLYVVKNNFNNALESFGTYEDCEEFIKEMAYFAPNASFRIEEYPSDEDFFNEYSEETFSGEI